MLFGQIDASGEVCSSANRQTKPWNGVTSVFADTPVVTGSVQVSSGVLQVDDNRLIKIARCSRNCERVAACWLHPSTQLHKTTASVSKAGCVIWPDLAELQGALIIIVSPWGRAYIVRVAKTAITAFPSLTAKTRVSTLWGLAASLGKMGKVGAVTRNLRIRTTSSRGGGW